MTVVAEWANLNLHKNRFMLTSSKTCSFASSLVHKVWLISLLLNKQATWNYIKLLKSVWSFSLSLSFTFSFWIYWNFALLISFSPLKPSSSSFKRGKEIMVEENSNPLKHHALSPFSVIYFHCWIRFTRVARIWCSIDRKKFTLQWIFNVPNRYWC